MRNRIIMGVAAIALLLVGTLAGMVISGGIPAFAAKSAGSSNRLPGEPIGGRQSERILPALCANSCQKLVRAASWQVTIACTPDGDHSNGQRRHDYFEAGERPGESAAAVQQRAVLATG